MYDCYWFVYAVLFNTVFHLLLGLLLKKKKNKEIFRLEILILLGLLCNVIRQYFRWAVNCCMERSSVL